MLLRAIGLSEDGLQTIQDDHLRKEFVVKWVYLTN